MLTVSSRMVDRRMLYLEESSTFWALVLRSTVRFHSYHTSLTLRYSLTVGKTCLSEASLFYIH